jgi:uncharacterized membrane protein YcaP (DUF421 family)
MWTLDYSLLLIVLRAAIIYVVVLIGLRLTGKSEVGQMTPFDLVLFLLVANAVQNAMTGPDTSVTGGIVAAVTLLVLNALVTRLVRRSRNVRNIVEGTPTLLIHSGKILEKNLAKENIPIQTLEQALREHGVASPADVYLATLEVDGAISVIRNDERPTTSQPHHHIRFIRRQNA